MAKIKQVSLADQVYELLKDQILNGTLKAGDKIPEEELAKSFGVSRTPIREALKKLNEYGLITIKPRAHAEVSKINEKEIVDIAKVRVALELLSIDGLTKENLTDNLEDISRYAAECQFAISMEDKAKIFEFDSLFHIALVKASNNKALLDLYVRLDAKVQLLRIEQAVTPSELSTYIDQHNKIIQLLKDNQKEEAKKLLSSHILHDLTGV